MTRRPWGDCNRLDGSPKRRLTEEQADYAVERVNARNPRHRQPVQKYQCPTCSWWHTGRMRRRDHWKLFEALAVELGERAWWNLVAENSGPDDERAQVILNRWRRWLRKDLPPFPDR